MDDTKPADKAPAVWALGLENIFRIDASGTIVGKGVYRTNDLVFPVPGPDLSGAIVTLNLGAEIETLLGAGAGIILGQPDSGKTLLIDSMAARNPGQVVTIRYREPEPDSLLYEHQLVEQLISALQSSASVIAIDSLRTTFYSSSGTTGKGGVNMGIFELVTAYDIIAKAYGKVILFALNPTTTDNDAIEFYLSAARGSVAHTIHTTAPKVFKLSSRTAKTRGFSSHKYEPLSKQERQLNVDRLTTQAGPRHLVLKDDGIADLYTLTQKPTY